MKGGISRDYYVPNFGQDQEVKDNLENLRTAENTMGNWPLHLGKKKSSSPPPVPNFGRDDDMNDSLADLAKAEHENGADMRTPKWDRGAVDFLQTNADIHREPLLSWNPKALKGSYDKNYYVPNFGQDQDMKDSLE